MKVFKFGGASVKDAEGVRNLKKVIDISSETNLIVVVSAMGKMTNHLEGIVRSYLGKNDDMGSQMVEFREYHHNIMMKLFSNANHSKS